MRRIVRRASSDHPLALGILHLFDSLRGHFPIYFVFCLPATRETRTVYAWYGLVVRARIPKMPRSPLALGIADSFS
jgi:hypothetical protein